MPYIAATATHTTSVTPVPHQTFGKRPHAVFMAANVNVPTKVLSISPSPSSNSSQNTILSSSTSIGDMGMKRVKTSTGTRRPLFDEGCSFEWDLTPALENTKQLYPPLGGDSDVSLSPTIVPGDKNSSFRLTFYLRDSFSSLWQRKLKGTHVLIARFIDRYGIEFTKKGQPVRASADIAVKQHNSFRMVEFIFSKACTNSATKLRGFYSLGRKTHFLQVLLVKKETVECFNSHGEVVLAAKPISAYDLSSTSPSTSPSLSSSTSSASSPSPSLSSGLAQILFVSRPVVTRTKVGNEDGKSETKSESGGEEEREMDPTLGLLRTLPISSSPSSIPSPQPSLPTTSSTNISSSVSSSDVSRVSTPGVESESDK